MAIYEMDVEKDYDKLKRRCNFSILLEINIAKQIPY